jgi:hypothetical protein
MQGLCLEILLFGFWSWGSIANEDLALALWYFPLLHARACGLFTLSYIRSLSSANLVAIILHFAYAGFDLGLFDHVGGLRILKVKRGWFHTDRPDQRRFISFQLYAYGCMPLNPHLT